MKEGCAPMLKNLASVETMSVPVEYSLFPIRCFNVFTSSHTTPIIRASPISQLTLCN